MRAFVRHSKGSPETVRSTGSSLVHREPSHGDPVPSAHAGHDFGRMSIHPEPRAPQTSPDGMAASTLDPKDLVDSRPVEDIGGAIDESEDEPASPEAVARKAAAAAGLMSPAAPRLGQSIDDACRGGGPALPSATRQRMERRFGHDFGRVRIHADPAAGRMASQVQARAFATGDHIFFAAGEFQPDRTSGQHLLAHELAHVVQQARGSGGLDRRIQRSGNGSRNCPAYAGYDTSQDLTKYNCTGLAQRTYDYRGLAATKTALGKGSSVACSTPCDSVGVVKHWLWEYDLHFEDSNGKVLVPPQPDFHTVGGPTDGDPLPKDSDEYYTKNGARKVYGPGTAPTFKPAVKEQSLKNDPSETPAVDSAGKPIYKVRSNFTESCHCLACPAKSP